MNPQIEVDPKSELKNAIKRAAKEVGDLTIPLTLIGQYWRRSNEAIFAVKGPGRYPDLSEKYKRFKRSILGSEYPIMLFNGRLMASITGTPNGESIQKILNKNSLVLGTSVPYAYFLANNRRKPRPVVLYGAEQTAPPQLNNRIEAWQEILAKYVAQRSQQEISR